MSRLLAWYDRHILKLLVAFLLISIPLYPKFPLIDIPNTWVYVRVEDFLIAAAFGIGAVQFLRKRVSLSTPLSWPIFLYWIIGFLSTFYTVLFFHTALDFYPHIAILHFLRRIEYMGVFFIAYWSIRDLKVTRDYLLLILVVFWTVFFYGMGQKFFGFPAFSTTNEEFAKGVPLFLQSGSRVLSTFAGHYDLAAWLVLVIPVFLSLVLAPFSRKNVLTKIVFGASSLFAFVLLLLTVSRISFGAYLVSLIFLFALQFSWSIKKRMAILGLILLFSLFALTRSADFSDRFGKILRVNRIAIGIGNLSKTIFQVEKPQEGELLPTSDVVPVPDYSRKKKEATPEASQEAIVKSYFIDKKTVDESKLLAQANENSVSQPPAVVFDRSISTRIYAEWPRALKAFFVSPIFGRGYSSITLATDNDYFRALGETGLFGFLALMAIFIVIFSRLKNYIVSFRKNLDPIILGLSAGVLGFLANAFFIDVLEASKVAISFWLIIGILIGTIDMYLKSKKTVEE